MRLTSDNFKFSELNKKIDVVDYLERISQAWLALHSTKCDCVKCENEKGEITYLIEEAFQLPEC